MTKGIAVHEETYNKLKNYRNEKECKSYDEAINLLFEMEDHLYEIIERMDKEIEDYAKIVIQFRRMNR